MSGPEKAPTRRQLKRAAKFKAIQHTALHLVLEGGLSELTIQRLARELGWSVGALYRYYDSKTALLVDLQKVVLTELNHDFKTLLDHLPPLEDEAITVVSRLITVIDHFRRVATDDPARFALLSALQSEPRHVLPDAEAQLVVSAMWEPLNTVMRLMEEAEALGVLEKNGSKAKTLLIWTSLQGLLQSRKLARLEPQLAESKMLCRMLISTYLRGWGAPAEIIEKAQLHVDRSC